jgi:hypothetical protein
MVGMFILALRQRIEFPVPSAQPEPPPAPLPRVVWVALLLSPVGMALVVAGVISGTRWMAQLGIWIMVGSLLSRPIFGWYWGRRTAASDGWRPAEANLPRRR